MAEREKRRQVALAHQEAIRQQLEERERKRREERDRRIKEEQEEELRIEREQEKERQRKEHELKLFKEKQEREKKRKEAIQEAIEIAQKTAVMEKTKKLNKQANNNITSNLNKLVDHNEDEVNSHSDKNDNHKEEKKNNSNKEQLNNTIKLTKSESVNNEINNNLDITENIPKFPRSPRSVEGVILPPTATQQLNNQHVTNRNINHFAPLATPLCTPRTENLGLVIPTPLEAIHNLQYALLVPTTPHAIQFPVNVPQTDRSCNTSRTENRVLTPTQYRNRNRRVCDSSTQTEESDFGRTNTDTRERVIREKITNLELSYENANRKERRSRSESLEERPKWGANRPPTRYLKQSEKDPLYQRRKLRQKIRDSKIYDDLQKICTKK